jgi:hypothetical protein
MMADEGPAITFGARAEARRMRACSSGVTTPFALAWFSRFRTRAWPYSSFFVSLKLSSSDWTPLKMRCSWVFWRALIHGVPAKLGPM